MRQEVLSEPRQISGGLALGAGLVAAALVAMRPFVPDGAGPSAAEAFALAVAALLAATVWLKAAAESGFVLPAWRVTAPLGALLLVGLAMTAFAANVWRAELALFAWFAAALGFGAVYALVARHEAEPGQRVPREREGERRLVLSALVATGGAAAVIGLAGAAAGFMPPGFRESPNAFACFLAMSIPLAVGVALSARRSKESRAAWTVAVIAALAAAALIVTSSEGGIVSAVAGVLAMLAFIHKERLRPLLAARLPKTAAGRALAIAALIAAAALGFFLLLEVSVSMRNRLEFWRAALAMIADNPLGVGLGNFGDHYWRYRTHAGLDTLDPRSSYLLLAAEAGLPALAALAALAWGVFRAAAGGGDGEANATRLAKSPPDPEVATEGVLGGFGLIGGATGLAAAFVSHDAIRAASLGPAALVAALLAVWAAVFMFVSRVRAGGRCVRAGLLGTLVAVAVHASAESVMSNGGVALAAAAACALALALAGGQGVRVGLGGWAGLARSAVFALMMGLVLWRGLGRQVTLWERAELAERSVARAVELDFYRDSLEASVEDRVDRPKLRALAAAAPTGLDVSVLATAVDASPDAEITRHAWELAERAEGLSLDWLREAWRMLDAYLAVEPADLERAVRLVEVDRLLAGKGDPGDYGATVERTLRTLARRSPATFVPWRELGELHASRGHMTQAAAALEEAARRNPTSPGLTLRLGDARALFDPEGALDAYRRAFESNRRLREARTGLFGRLWRARPRRPESADFLIALERMQDSLGPRPETTLRLAMAAVDYGGFAEARDLAEKAREMDPNDPQTALFAAAFAEMAAALEEDVAASEADDAWRRAEAVQRAAPAELRMQTDAFEFILERRDLFRFAGMGMPTR